MPDETDGRLAQVRLRPAQPGALFGRRPHASRAWSRVDLNVPAVSRRRPLRDDRQVLASAPSACPLPVTERALFARWQVREFPLYADAASSRSQSRSVQKCRFAKLLAGLPTRSLRG